MSTDIETKLYELKNEFLKQQHDFKLKMIDFKHDIATLRNELTEQQGLVKILRSVDYEIKKDFKSLQKELSIVKQIEQLRADILLSGKSTPRVNKAVCSFCGKNQDEVEKMIVGSPKRSVFICDTCVGCCNELFSDMDFKIKLKQQEEELEEQEINLNGW
jgi:hypothetical protein